MKNLVLILLAISSMLLLSCQREKDICGSWQLSSLNVKTDSTQIKGPLFLRTIGSENFGSLEFTEDHKMIFYDRSGKLLYEGGFLFSEFGKEILIKGREDLVYMIKINDENSITLYNEEANIALSRKHCYISP
jgi:hypothetical protein